LNAGEQTKVCRKCGKTLPATTDYFYKHKNSAQGLNPRCRMGKNQNEENGRIL